MKNSLKQFRTGLSEVVLDFLWSAWSHVGVMGSAVPSKSVIVDPEPLLLLTWGCGRQDPRVFDEVLDWLVRNGRWINVVRLTTLVEEDRACPPSLAGAIAAFMLRYDKSPKWRTLAQRYKPKKTSVSEILFQRDGKALGSHRQCDEDFLKYGWLRLPVSLRKQSQPVAFWKPAGLILKSRAFFGVNIRADVFAWLVANGSCSASRLARELGYSQRRVQDTLMEMQIAGAFQVHHDGNRKEYSVSAQKGWQLLFDSEPEATLAFHWRAFARGISKIWKKTFSLKEEGLTPYILESELTKAADEAREDLVSAGVVLPPRMESWQLLAVLKKQLQLQK